MFKTGKEDVNVVVNVVVVVSANFFVSALIVQRVYACSDLVCPAAPNMYYI